MADLLHDRIIWSLDDTVARITLAHPANGNALDISMASGVAEAARRVRDGALDGTVRIAVLDAAGPAFCVGGDLREFAGATRPAEHVGQVADVLHEAIVTLGDAQAPIVTVVQGTAAGGGIGIALAGDIVLVAREAKLRLAYTAAGLSPDCGSSWVLPARVGLARALDLALTNRAITGQQAADWGLVSRAVDREVLGTEAASVVMTLSAGSAGALAATKRLMRDARTRSLPVQLGFESVAIASLIRDGEGREGMQAFLEKRSAQFG